jgi:hypothetical protein
MGLVIEPLKKAQILKPPLNAPEPTDAPSKDWLYLAVSGHNNFSTARH